DVVAGIALVAFHDVAGVGSRCAIDRRGFRAVPAALCLLLGLLLLLLFRAGLAVGSVLRLSAKQHHGSGPPAAEYKHRRQDDEKDQGLAGDLLLRRRCTLLALGCGGLGLF